MRTFQSVSKSSEPVTLLNDGKCAAFKHVSISCLRRFTPNLGDGVAERMHFLFGGVLYTCVSPSLVSVLKFARGELACRKGLREYPRNVGKHASGGYSIPLTGCYSVPCSWVANRPSQLLASNITAKELSTGPYGDF